jgi:hypothetical protein
LCLYRYGLLNMVLISEQEIADTDSDRMDSAMTVLRSDKFMLSNQLSYFTYLLNNSALKKVKYFVPSAAADG